MKIKKKLLSLALSGVMVLGLMPGMSLTALAADNVSTYTLQIPSTLTVSTAGWNETSGLTAAVSSGDTFDSGKKLSVTATSANSWSLVSGSNSVGYNLATATGTYSSTATPVSWEFTAAELNASGGTNKAMGIVVEDYSNKPAGTYQDTVTFMAKVEDAVTAPLAALKTDGTTFEFNGDNGYGAPITITFTVSNGQATDIKMNGNSNGNLNCSLANDRLTITIFSSFTYFDADLGGTTFTSGSSGSVTVKINGTDITSQLTRN